MNHTFFYKPNWSELELDGHIDLEGLDLWDQELEWINLYRDSIICNGEVYES